MDRFGKLTKQARDFLEKVGGSNSVDVGCDMKDQWERRWFEAVQKTKTDQVAFFGEMIQMLPDCLNEVKDFTPETWSSLMEQFPEMYSMWNEHKQMFGNFDEITQELPTDNKTTESKQSMELNVLPTGSLKM
ncbi:hypothetical protein OESDEN_25399 [Oesophagostomum dentatum]|uniref:Uncharacterized protein n=1 Tax=Oesophagostomum dentatum TaxID=61180 RepID=A0A0B1RV95_OESDE|nr:hypothetical protein OESDEN_25399 [Oesophagostomum dentatum]